MVQFFVMYCITVIFILAGYEKVDRIENPKGQFKALIYKCSVYINSIDTKYLDGICALIVRPNLHPTNIRIMENIFSLSVLGATFPNPTEISPVKQKYRLVQYRL